MQRETRVYRGEVTVRRRPTLSSGVDLRGKGPLSVGLVVSWTAGRRGPQSGVCVGEHVLDRYGSGLRKDGSC